MKQLPNLDLVRAIAVLLVVAEHILLAHHIMWIGPFEILWVGVAGVFLFFVHTSLVLMWSLQRKPYTLDFYIRRAFRIYQLAITVIVIALATHAPVSGTPSNFFVAIHPHPLELLSNLLLTQNLIAAPLVMGVMWTLCLEVEMYLTLPALFFYVQRNFSEWPILILWVLAVLFGKQFDPNSQNFAVAVPYFLCGVLAYVGFSRRKAILPAWLLPITLTIITAAYLYKPNFHIAWFYCLAVGLGLPRFHQIRSETLIRTTHTIAKYSYGIYLTHSFAIVLGIHLLPAAAPTLQVFIVVAATAIFSFAAYHLVEAPLIRIGSRIANLAEKRYEQHEAPVYLPG